ncbi:MAG: GNAT family N-acetyltransferase [Saprospiraceae bacterium]|nr:MAG: acetyltransferase [Bacteroidetes bacterium OLB9]MCO6463485.1 GNAT family N-acetyltransferase [Saprospiraceae bacterium]MCZ2338542.1 GNAT family N-acetyltransferase [Chitinophagales bacterium]
MSLNVQFDTQPILQTEDYLLLPVKEEDFEAVYAAASDPEVWSQHPNKNRWQRDVFCNFFEGALQSGGAFKIIDKKKDVVIGSTRIYDYNTKDNSVLIGYTFFAKAYWGCGANQAVKTLMLDYLFQYVDKVIFHIGSLNMRSKISIERLGAVKTGELDIAYHGEPVRHNDIYVITKESWMNR